MWNKQRYCGQLQSHVWITNFRREELKKHPYSENFRISSLSYDMEGHAKKCVERYCELANKTTQQPTKYPLHALMIITLKRKNWHPWKNCQKYALKMFWNACTWHVLEDLIFYGQWTNLQDRLRNGPEPVTNAWIDWYLTFITHVNINSIVMWVILQNNAGWDCFKTLILQETLKSRSQHQEDFCAFSEVRTFVPISWMCEKQTSVSHSSTESEIISLDAGQGSNEVAQFCVGDFLLCL